jgi:hypothetical protein
MSSPSPDPFELTPDELSNISKTVESLRDQIMRHVKNGVTVPETLHHRLKKAYKLQQEEDFNRQFIK